MFSSTRTKAFPSLKYCACEGINFTPSSAPIAWASFGLAEPARIARSPCGGWNGIRRGPESSNRGEAASDMMGRGEGGSSGASGANLHDSRPRTRHKRAIDRSPADELYSDHVFNGWRGTALRRDRRGRHEYQ